MRAMIDTCVIVDVLQSREPFCESGQKIFLLAANERFTGCISAKSATDIYYLSHRLTHDGKRSREILEKLFELFEVVDTTGEDCRRALASPVGDYEDAVLAESAVRASLDCVVTRNGRDFKHAPIPVLTPEEFLKKLADEESPE